MDGNPMADLPFRGIDITSWAMSRNQCTISIPDPVAKEVNAIPAPDGLLGITASADRKY